MKNFEHKKNRYGSDSVRISCSPATVNDEDILNSRITELNNQIEILEEKKDLVKTNIESLERTKEELENQISGKEQRINELNKSIEELESKLNATGAKLNDKNVSDEIMSNTTTVLSPQILKLLSMAFSTIRAFNDSDDYHVILDMFVSVLHNLGYELLPYSEINKDMYVVKETGKKRNIRTAIRKITTGELVIFGEINL